MTYEDALLALAAGREVRRPFWVSDTRLGITNHPNGFGLAIAWRGRHVVEGIYEPDPDDRHAKDWQIVRDPSLSEGVTIKRGLEAMLTDKYLAGEPEFEPLAAGVYAGSGIVRERAQTAAEKALKDATPPEIEIAHAFDDLLDSVDRYLGPRLSTERAYFEARLREAQMWAQRHVEQTARARG
jgi:hypothetical protein